MYIPSWKTTCEIIKINSEVYKITISETFIGYTFFKKNRPKDMTTNYIGSIKFGFKNLDIKDHDVLPSDKSMFKYIVDCITKYEEQIKLNNFFRDYIDDNKNN